MAVDITTTTNVPGSPPDVTEINDNFDLIKTELDSFPQEGALAAGAVGVDHLQTEIIIFNKIDPDMIDTTITDVDDKIPTSGAIVDYLLQPRGVQTGYKQAQLSVGTGSKEKAGPRAFSDMPMGKVLCVKAEVCFTTNLGGDKEEWFDVNHTRRASGTDGGLRFGSSWYRYTGPSTIACYCDVYYGGMDEEGAAQGDIDKTVRWTVIYSA